MPDFGASIPPKVYQRFGYVDYSRRELAIEIARGLDAVGMQFHEATSTYNILDPSMATTSRPDNVNGNCASFFFTFPTAETFERRPAGAAAVQYRPCLVMAMGGGMDSSSYIGPTRAAGHIHLSIAIFPADQPPSIQNIITFNTLRNSPTAWRGLYQDYNDGSDMNLNRYISVPNHGSWKPYADSAMVNWVKPLQVKSLTIHLGPGGLIIAGGRADSPSDKTNISALFNYICVFGGKRIPNRARLPVNDPELSRVCPVLEWYAYTGGEATWGTVTGPTSTMRFVNLFAQYDTRDSLADGQGVYTYAYALDLADNRFGAISTFPSIISPRTIAGVARNVLSPVVLRPLTGYEGSDANYGYFYPRTSDGVYDLTSWEDMYYTDTFRTTDPSMPVGENTDPDTGDKWWGHYLTDASCMCAYKLGASYTAMSTLPVRSYGADVVHTYDFTNITVVSGQQIPAGAGIATPVTVTYTQAQGSLGTFTKPAGQNYFTSDIPYSNTAHAPCIEFEIDLPPGIDTRWVPVFNSSGFLRGGTMDNATYNYVNLEYYPNWLNNPGWGGIVTHLFASGANTGHASYNYAVLPPRMLSGAHANNSPATYKLRFRFRHYYYQYQPLVGFRLGDISISFRRWQ